MLKSLIINSDLTETIKDDPIVSSILDTDEPVSWIHNSFNNNNWNLIILMGGCLINTLTINLIPNEDMKNIKKHLYISFFHLYLFFLV